MAKDGHLLPGIETLLRKLASSLALLSKHWEQTTASPSVTAATMLEASVLEICLFEAEGCSHLALASSDLVCRTSTEALEMSLYPKWLIATLRQ